MQFLNLSLLGLALLAGSWRPPKALPLLVIAVALAGWWASRCREAIHPGRDGLKKWALTLVAMQ